MIIHDIWTQIRPCRHCCLGRFCAIARKTIALLWCCWPCAISIYANCHYAATGERVCLVAACRCISRICVFKVSADGQIPPCSPHTEMPLGASVSLALRCNAPRVSVDKNIYALFVIVLLVPIYEPPPFHRARFVNESTLITCFIGTASFHRRRSHRSHHIHPSQDC